MADNAAPKQPGGRTGRPFEKGQSGNPKGKAPGTRSAITILGEKIMQDDADEIVRAVVAAAKAGDPTAMRLCVERLIPVRKGRPLQVDLPAIEKAADLPAALGQLLRLVGEGAVTPEEAQSIGVLLETQRRSIELADIEERLAKLEERK